MLKNSNNFFGWLDLFFLAMQASIAGLVLDNLIRAFINFLKIGKFEIFVSSLFFIILIVLTLFLSLANLFLSTKGDNVFHSKRLSLIFTIYILSGLLLLWLGSKQ